MRARRTVASARSETKHLTVEIVEGDEEGIERLNGFGPVAIERGDDGRVIGITVRRCHRVYDEARRFAPIFDDADRQTLECDTVLLAVGQTPNLAFLEDGGADIAQGRPGWPQVDQQTLATTAPGVFVAGDLAHGTRLLIHAVASGKADLGWAGARIFDAVGIRDFNPLQAPMLVDSYELGTGYNHIAVTVEGRRLAVGLDPLAGAELQAAEVGVDFFPSRSDEKPVAIAEAAIRHAKIQFHDVVLVDTAGRLAIDEAMMAEIQALHRAVAPQETLFVVDAMTGQDAANTAKAFADALPLTGVILTKADGDARGGAALSVRHVTGKPIRFMGVGEKVDALEPFHPDRVASRILGMGDVLSLIEEAERTVDKKKAEKLVRKVKKGQGFDLEDFRDQLQQLKKMGGMGGLLGKLPGMGQMAELAQGPGPEKELGKLEALINSMTPQERRRPEIINGSRKRRIAAGAGLQVPDLNRLLKQHKQMQKMMKKAGKKGGMQNMMRGMSGMMGGGGPGGMGGPGGFPWR